MKAFCFVGSHLRASLCFSPYPPQRSAFTGRARRILVMVTRVTARGDSNIIMAAMRAATGPGTALESAPQPWRRGR
jgi:hypothetical protein